MASRHIPKYLRVGPGQLPIAASLGTASDGMDFSAATGICRLRIGTAALPHNTQKYVAHPQKFAPYSENGTHQNTMIVSILLPAVVLLVVVLLSRGRKVPKGYRLVPGPKGLPLIGNTLEVPQSRPEKKFMEWAKEYGELFRVQIGWNDWVFVNSDVAVKVFPAPPCFP